MGNGKARCPPYLALPPVTMTYSAANRLATYNEQAVQFDAEGNLLTGPLAGEMAEFRFDSRNRLVQAGETSYRYDAENQRIGVNHLVTTRSKVMPPGRSASSDLNELPRVNRHQAALNAERPHCITTRSVVTR